MKTFKQLLDYIFEGKHDPEHDEEMFRLLSLDHSQVSKNKDNKNYEDRGRNALKRLNSADHGEESVRNSLYHNHNHPNRWIRMGVANHPELHNYPDIHKALLADSSPVVANLAAAERKPAKSASAPVAKKPAEKASPAASKPAKVAAPKAAKPSGKLEVVPGDPEELPYATRISDVKKGNRIVAKMVSGSIPDEYDVDKPFHHSYVTHTYPDGEEGLKRHDTTHISHEHGLLALVNHLKGKQ